MLGPLVITRYDRAPPGRRSVKSALSYVYGPEHVADHSGVFPKSRSAKALWLASRRISRRTYKDPCNVV